LSLPAGVGPGKSAVTRCGCSACGGRASRFSSRYGLARDIWRQRAFQGAIEQSGALSFLRASSARAGRDASPFTGIRSHGRVSLCWRARGERPRQGCAVGRGVLILDPSIHTHATISGAASPRTAEKLARDAWQPTLSKHLLARRLFTGWPPSSRGGRAQAGVRVVPDGCLRGKHPKTRQTQAAGQRGRGVKARARACFQARAFPREGNAGFARNHHGN